MGNSLTKLLIASAAVTAMNSAIEPGHVNPRFKLVSHIAGAPRVAGYGLLGPAGPLRSDAELLEFVEGLEQPESVTYLHLSYGVSDFAPLARLTGLRSLDLRSCHISDLSPLAGLTQLKRLWLSGTQLTDISPLAGLKDLEDLDLSGTRVSDLTQLEGLTQLKSLGLSDTKISDLSPLRGLTALESLHIENTAVSNIDALQGATESGALQTLYLGGTQIEEFPAWASKWKAQYIRVTLQSLNGETLHQLFGENVAVWWMSHRVKSVLTLDANPRFIFGTRVLGDQQTLSDLRARNGGTLRLTVVFSRAA